MNSEKVKEIKKGLEVCTGICDETCPYYTKPCITDLSKDALTLINELESENERWKKDCADIANDYQEMGNFYYEEVKKNQQLKDRITELEKENKDYYDRLNNLQTYIDNHEEIWKGNTKIQLKQFAERLKEKFYYVFGNEYEQSVSGFDTKVLIEHIDETLKEFLNK